MSIAAAARQLALASTLAVLLDATAQAATATVVKLDTGRVRGRIEEDGKRARERQLTRGSCAVDSPAAASLLSRPRTCNRLQPGENP